MGAIKKYFANEFQGRMSKLEHDKVDDFYVCSWQQNRSPVQLLCIETILLLGCLGILLTSTIMTGIAMGFGYWFIYLTHWGLLLITLATGFGFAVSVRAYKGPIDCSLGIPWYVKTYWIIYNTATPVAFLITIFYWAFLQNMEEGEYAVNRALDIFIHAVNSVIMVLLLITSRVPSRALHVYQPIVFALVYMFFSVIYYFAGGTDPFGRIWIYPMLDWSQPGPTIIMVVITALLLVIVYIFIVLISLLRDYVTGKFKKGVYETEGYF